MSKEMTRREARASGYDDTDAPVTVPASPSSSTPQDGDVIDVWAQQPDADDVPTRAMTADELAESFPGSTY